ncbi:hypothetical protein [Lysobacter firmicutimachus]|uniref:Uncharacterized protein n=1 Tax=Lysobacter firmicutimachus TaxID=1792846 RepID=A0ABU8D2G7_9GAMM
MPALPFPPRHRAARLSLPLLCLAWPLLAAAAPPPSTPPSTPASPPAAPTLDQAIAAQRAALAAESPAATPMGQALVESIRLSELRLCGPLREDRVDCIVRLESGLGGAYQTYRFQRRDGAWILLPLADLAPPAPSRTQAQALLRADLLLRAPRLDDTEQRGRYERAAASLIVSALEGCELDRDEGRVSCDVGMRLPEGDDQATLRFVPQADGTWRLDPPR